MNGDVTGFPAFDHARKRYLAHQVETASPVQRLLMLLERLYADVRGAQAAFESGETEEVHNCLVHAQEIVIVLHDVLATSSWSGASSLRAIYRFVHKQLVVANLTKDPGLLPVCIDIIVKIKEADEQAARELSPEETVSVA